MGAVPIGIAGNTGLSHSYNNIGYNPPHSKIRTSVNKGSSLARTLKQLGRVVAPVATVASRANPYIAGAMILYEAYDYFTSPDSSSSTSVSPAIGIVSSSDNKVTTPVFDFDTSVKSLKDSASSPILLPEIDISDLGSSTVDGQTLLSVLEANNKNIMSGMAKLLESNNAIAVSTSNVAKSVNALGLILSQIASDNSSMGSIKTAFYVDLLKILSTAFPEKSRDADDSIANDFEDLYISEDGYTDSVPTRDPFGIRYSGITETILDDAELEDGTPLRTDSEIASLISAINPQVRMDYFTKQNTIADIKTTPAEIKDLDGNTVVTDSPLNIKTRAEASTARKHTDQNNFEMEDADFDLWDSLPPMDFLEYVGNSSIY